MKKILIIIGIIAVLFLGAYFSMKTDTAQGSVTIGGEYQSTSTDAMGAGITRVIGLRNTSPAIAQSSTTLYTLGSVIIASSSATQIKMWDATSTSDVASTSINVFEANATEGSYDYDINLRRGLIIQLPAGFNGSVLFKYR